MAKDIEKKKKPTKKKPAVKKTKKTNSKAKGAKYEREVANALKEYGYEDSHRTSQFCGKPQKEGGCNDASDVVGLPGIHIECKHYANKGFDYKWMEQAQRDCGENLPAVFHRIDRKETVVTMTLDDFMKLYRAYEQIILKD